MVKFIRKEVEHYGKTDFYHSGRTGKSRKVADAFAELYEMAEIMVLDADRYGFVMLKYYELSSGFAEDETYTDSEKLFDALWEEWLNTKLTKIRKALCNAGLFLMLLLNKKDRMMGIPA